MQCIQRRFDTFHAGRDERRDIGYQAWIHTFVNRWAL